MAGGLICPCCLCSTYGFCSGTSVAFPPATMTATMLWMRTLLPKGVPTGCSVIRMEAENIDREAATKAYDKLLPETIDILLLGMGTDGHIASLFPHSSALHLDQRSVAPVMGPNPPHERLTITPQIIASAGSVFLLATGEEKGRVLAEALKSPEDFASLPVRLTLGSTWLLDEEAMQKVLDS